MYCIKKFADCWAIINLNTDKSRPLTEEEVGVLRQEIPTLNDTGVAAYYTDTVNCISDKP
jgi:hypothetical protein